MGLNLSLYRGEKREYTFTLTDQDGDPIDLTGGQTVTLQAYTALPPGEATALWSPAVEGTNPGADGTITLTLTGTHTEVEPMRYYYLITVTYPDSSEYVAERGRLTILAVGDGTGGKCWNIYEDLQRKLGIYSEDQRWTPTDLQAELEEAHRRVIQTVGTHEVWRGYGHQDSDRLTYHLPHGSLLTVLRVEHNGTEVSSDNYTLDYAGGSITFTSSENIRPGDLIRVDYIPEVYADLEMLYAIRGILRSMYLSSFDSDRKAELAQVREDINDLLAGIAAKNCVAAIRDHGFRGR